MQYPPSRVIPLRPARAICLGSALAFFVTLSACDSAGSNEPNESPSASFSFSPDGAPAGTNVSFANQSADADGEIERYSWDFNGDGREDDSRRNPSYTFDQEGTHTVTLTVTDDEGAEASTSEAVSVGARFNNVTITRVSVEALPFTNDSGAGWDLFDGPDVYYRLYDANEDLIVSKKYYEDIGRSDLPLTWDERLVISDLNDEYKIRLWDSDYDAHDFIGGIVFSLEDLQGDYPNSITMEPGEIRVRLYLAWEHDGRPMKAGGHRQEPLSSAKLATPPTSFPEGYENVERMPVQ